MHPSNRARTVVILIVLVLAVSAGSIALNLGSGAELEVYCAHDAEYSAAILQEFEQQTGIRLAVRYDTEATKSLGLVNQILQEANSPRCDVFWNNQALGTIALAERGLLQEYRGPGFARIPEQYRDPAGKWAGFGARLRVYIVNTNMLPADPERIEAALNEGDLSRVAIANPLFGTTLSNATALWHFWGPEKTQAWFRDIHERGIREVAGNGMVKNLVASGVCDWGFTDTDDFYSAKDAGQPVEMLPIRVEGKTLCIPNTVAIVRGTKRAQDAQRLVDFLLSKEVELKLARSGARQIPLGPVEDGELPADVKHLQQWTENTVDLREIAPDRAACLEWLKAQGRGDETEAPSQGRTGP
jgi:iron(III) transport system substrate-binding protein